MDESTEFYGFYDENTGEWVEVDCSLDPEPYWESTKHLF